MLARLPEQRKTAHCPIRRRATLSFGATVPPVACVIWDISEGGARLAIARSIADIPHHFTLNLYKHGSLKWACEVVWTDWRFTGVKFLGFMS
jgi:hypothetical protein